jgi:hippurate hydrolase
MHNAPGLPAGQFQFRAGAFLASSDRVLLRFTGKAGHGAMPHLAVDPTPAAAATLLALQTIVSRNLDPIGEQAVVSVGRMAAGASYNVIPESAELELSVRALDPLVRDRLQDRIESIARGQAESYGVALEIHYERGYPVLVNDAAMTRFAAQVARDRFGTTRVQEGADPLMGSEDFAYFLQQVPGCYLLIGNGANGHAQGQCIGPCSVHNPHYDFNDACLTEGAAYWVALAQAFFAQTFFAQTPSLEPRASQAQAPGLARQGMQAPD